jgi:hypothetical protein
LWTAQELALAERAWAAAAERTRPALAAAEQMLQARVAEVAAEVVLSRAVLARAEQVAAEPAP